VPFKLAGAGSRAECTFNVTAPMAPGDATITATAKVGNRTFAASRTDIRYPHIPPQTLQPPAKMTAVNLDLSIRGKAVGYIPGAGDSVAEALEQMGYAVTRLTGADLTPEKLAGLDAVVVGIRALNVRTDLAPHMADLFRFAENGGNLIIQYNR